MLLEAVVLLWEARRRPWLTLKGKNVATAATANAASIKAGAGVGLI